MKGVIMKCPKCDEILEVDSLYEGYDAIYVCPHCGAYIT